MKMEEKVNWKDRCERCENCFTEKTEFDNHICTSIGDELDSNREGSETLLVQKSVDPDSVMDRWRCRYCDQMFSNESQHDEHIGSTHDGERPYKCESCPKSFNRSFNLKVHVRTHTGERPFRCQYCPKSFTRQHSLNRHIHSHTSERSHKGPVNASNLKTHLRTRAKERPSRWSLASESSAGKAVLSERSPSRIANCPWDARKCSDSPDQTSTSLRVPVQLLRSLTNIPPVFQSFTSRAVFIRYLRKSMSPAADNGTSGAGTLIAETDKSSVDNVIDLRSVNKLQMLHVETFGSSEPLDLTIKR